MNTVLSFDSIEVLHLQQLQTTKHAAVEKACDLLRIKMVELPCDPHTFELSPAAVEVCDSTVLLKYFLNFASLASLLLNGCCLSTAFGIDSASPPTALIDFDFTPTEASTVLHNPAPVHQR
jgi:hypothetical protein